MAFGATAALFVATATGALYAWEGEGRTVGLGEERHWFPHAAVSMAGRPGMPDRSVCFHNGHAALYEYKYAPDRKTYADARLEVIGPELFKAYTDLQGKIAHNSDGWEDELERMGRPLVLTDNVQALMSDVTATMLSSPRYRCVWFDPVAALSSTRAIRARPRRTCSTSAPGTSRARPVLTRPTRRPSGCSPRRAGT